MEMTAAAGSGHPSTSMSLGHIITVLLFNTMRWSPEYPDYPTADRLVLSEGHAVPIVYAACAKLGVSIGKDPEHRRPMTVADAMKLREAASEIDDIKDAQKLLAHSDSQITKTVYRRVGERVKPTR
jgi:transketolase